MSRGGLRQIEKRAWLRTFEHGLWDIGIGVMLASFGASILTGYVWLSPIWISATIPLMQGVGTRFIAPRIGRATFHKRRKRSMVRIQLLLTGLAVAGLGMFLFTSWSTQPSAPEWVGWFRAHFVVVIGAIWGGALAIGAWAVDVPRLYAYAVLLFAAMLVSDLTAGYNLGHALVAAGSAIALTGITLLIRFIRRYPRHPIEEDMVSNG
ncbi:hypothetical protein KJ567_04065 [Candidatus Bipolaricaulota bacterium]|nr:hypothetical protein [Candidatus Bipolaricaulota bacterium]